MTNENTSVIEEEKYKDDAFEVLERQRKEMTYDELNASVVSSPDRRREEILKLLEEKPMRNQDIATALHVPSATINYDLNILRNEGKVKNKRVSIASYWGLAEKME